MTRPAWRIQDRISRARVEAALTQQQLADELGISRQAVNRWEQGRALPRRRDLMAIAQVTGVDYDWLTDNEEQLVSARHNVRSAKDPPLPAGIA